MFLRLKNVNLLNFKSATIETRGESTNPNKKFGVDVFKSLLSKTCSNTKFLNFELVRASLLIRLNHSSPNLN